MDIHHRCHCFLQYFLISICSSLAVAGDTIKPLPAQRIITLSPHATELVQAVGGESLLIAAAITESIDLPADIPRITTYGGMDRELILQLAPDLVIAWTSGNRPSDLAWLGAQGIPVYHSDPSRLTELAKQMRAIGQQIGRAKSAAIAADHFTQALQHNHCIQQNPTETYLQIWPRPAMSVGGQHWLNDLMHYAGMRNTYTEVTRGIFVVEAESLFSKQHLLQLSGNRAVQAMPNSIWAAHLGRPGPALLKVIQKLCTERQTHLEN